MDRGAIGMMKLQHIKDLYDEFRLELLHKGRLPMRETPVGFWGTSIVDEIISIFRHVHLQKYSHFLDLGSGDGRVALVASLFTKSAGIEMDLPLFNKSLEMKGKLGIETEFFHGDFMQHDISRYDMVFCYPDKPLYMGLRDKLRNELTGKLILYGRLPDNCNLRQLESFRVNGTSVGIYSQ